MGFMYWWRMQEFVRKRMKVPNTMLVRHEMVMYLHGYRERGEGWEVGTEVDVWKKLKGSASITTDV